MSVGTSDGQRYDSDLQYFLSTQGGQANLEQEDNSDDQSAMQRRDIKDQRRGLTQPVRLAANELDPFHNMIEGKDQSRVPQIDRDHHVPLVASAVVGPDGNMAGLAIDHRVPSNPEYEQFLAMHEEAELKHMKNLIASGMGPTEAYHEAHDKIATPIETAAVKAHAVNMGVSDPEQYLEGYKQFWRDAASVSKQPTDRPVHPTAHTTLFGLDSAELPALKTIQKTEEDQTDPKMMSVLDKLFGMGGVERYQLWPERAIRSMAGALSLPKEVAEGKIDPNSEEFYDRTMDLAGLALGGTSPFRTALKDAGLAYPAMVTLNDYVGMGYTRMNKYLAGLRGGAAKLYDPFITHPQVKLLDHLIGKSKPVEDHTVVYRGMSGQPFKDAQEGDVLHFPAFTSTSRSQNTANLFSGPDGTNLRILIPKGSKALDVNKQFGVANTLGEYEQEMLLPRNSKFRVLNSKQDMFGHKLEVALEPANENVIPKTLEEWKQTHPELVKYAEALNKQEKQKAYVTKMKGLLKEVEKPKEFEQKPYHPSDDYDLDNPEEFAKYVKSILNSAE